MFLENSESALLFMAGKMQVLTGRVSRRCITVRYPPPAIVV